MVDATAYVLDDQIGFVLRKATQRHIGIFAEGLAGVTTTQFAVLARLSERGPQSQNMLGRATALDGATVKGVVDRLVRDGLVTTMPDQEDRRRLIVDLTLAGRQFFHDSTAKALEISAQTLAPLSVAERDLLFELLTRLT